MNRSRITLLLVGVTSLLEFYFLFVSAQGICPLKFDEGAANNTRCNTIAKLALIYSVSCQNHFTFCPSNTKGNASDVLNRLSDPSLKRCYVCNTTTEENKEKPPQTLPIAPSCDDPATTDLCVSITVLLVTNRESCCDFWDFDPCTALGPYGQQTILYIQTANARLTNCQPNLLIKPSLLKSCYDTQPCPTPE